MPYLNTYPRHHTPHDKQDNRQDIRQDSKAALYVDYELPKFIDLAPLEAALRGLCALVGLICERQLYKELGKASRRVQQAVRVLIAAGEHNARLERKLAMLASPVWRARVLRDLGGEAALERWVRIMERRRAVMDALFNGKTQERGKSQVIDSQPSEAQLLARAANLQKAKLALFRKRFQKACRERGRGFDMPNAKRFVDRFKVDQEGEFRLAPLKRLSAHKRALGTRHKSQESQKSLHKSRYSKLDPIKLYPAEFHAAKVLSALQPDKKQDKKQDQEGDDVTETGSQTAWPHHVPPRPISDLAQDNKPKIDPDPD